MILLIGCATGSRYDYAREPDPRRHELVLGPADLLRINVWKNPELSSDARIRPDGTITLPLIGDLVANGRTPKQLKEELTRRLQSYLREESSIVSVAVVEVNSYRFSVSGNVEHGGIFAAKYYVTVVEAVAMAGGLNKFANPHALVIVRNDARSGIRRIPIDYERVSSGAHPEENLPLLASDTLLVP
jgi:polysaccharide export outer membrane protein